MERKPSSLSGAHHTEWGFLGGLQALLAWALPAWPLFPIPLQVSPSMQLLPEEECGILNGGVARKQLPHALHPCRARGYSSFSRKNAVLHVHILCRAASMCTCAVRPTAFVFLAASGSCCLVGICCLPRTPFHVCT